MCKLADTSNPAFRLAQKCQFFSLCSPAANATKRPRNEGVDRGRGYGDNVGGIGGGEGGIGGGGVESGVEGRGAGVDGAGSGDRGGGESGKIWREIDFLNRKFRENGSFRPISYIKVHQGKHAYLCGLLCHTTHVMYGASRISA